MNIPTAFKVLFSHQSRKLLKLAEAVAINRLKPPPSVCRNSCSSTLDCHGVSQSDPTNTVCMLGCIVCVCLPSTTGMKLICPPLVCLIYILCYWFAIDKTIRNDIILHSLSSEFTIQFCLCVALKIVLLVSSQNC